MAIDYNVVNKQLESMKQTLFGMSKGLSTIPDRYRDVELTPNVSLESLGYGGRTPTYTGPTYGGASYTPSAPLTGPSTSQSTSGNFDVNSLFAPSQPQSIATPSYFAYPSGNLSNTIESEDKKKERELNNGQITDLNQATKTNVPTRHSTQWYNNLINNTKKAIAGGSGLAGMYNTYKNNPIFARERNGRANIAAGLAGIPGSSTTTKDVLSGIGKGIGTGLANIGNRLRVPGTVNSTTTTGTTLPTNTIPVSTTNYGGTAPTITNDYLNGKGSNGSDWRNTMYNEGTGGHPNTTNPSGSVQNSGTETTTTGEPIIPKTKTGDKAITTLTDLTNNLGTTIAGLVQSVLDLQNKKDTTTPADAAAQVAQMTAAAKKATPQLDAVLSSIDDMDGVISNAMSGIRKSAEGIRNNPNLSFWQQQRRLRELDDIQNYAPIFHGLSLRDLIDYRKQLVTKLNFWNGRYNTILKGIMNLTDTRTPYEKGKEQLGVKTDELVKLSKLFNLANPYKYDYNDYTDDKGNITRVVTRQDPTTGQTEVIQTINLGPYGKNSTKTSSSTSGTSGTSGSGSGDNKPVYNADGSMDIAGMHFPASGNSASTTTPNIWGRLFGSH